MNKSIFSIFLLLTGSAFSESLFASDPYLEPAMGRDVTTRIIIDPLSSRDMVTRAALSINMVAPGFFCIDDSAATGKSDGAFKMRGALSNGHATRHERLHAKIGPLSFKKFDCTQFITLIKGCGTGDDLASFLASQDDKELTKHINSPLIQSVEEYPFYIGTLLSPLQFAVLQFYQATSEAHEESSKQKIKILLRYGKKYRLAQKGTPSYKISPIMIAKLIFYISMIDDIPGTPLGIRSSLNTILGAGEIAFKETILPVAPAQLNILSDEPLTEAELAYFKPIYGNTRAYTLLALLCEDNNTASASVKDTADGLASMFATCATTDTTTAKLKK